ncbi:hypothetical protein [Evansella clarkii]|uniref:hypothetical protein n=1 Tax=Evansella clarkii TaxID=79879 RepID=UPI001064DB23|nr:hypothetical protein [Evansella clarkii]
MVEERNQKKEERKRNKKAVPFVLSTSMLAATFLAAGAPVSADEHDAEVKNHGEIVSLVAETIPGSPEKGYIMDEVSQGNYELAQEALSEYLDEEEIVTILPVEEANIDEAEQDAEEDVEEVAEELVAANHGDVVSAVAEVLPGGPEKGEVMSQVAQGDYELAAEVLGEYGVTLVIEEDAIEEDAAEDVVEEDAIEEDAAEDVVEEDAIEEDVVEEDVEEDAIEEDAAEDVVEEDAIEEDAAEDVVEEDAIEEDAAEDVVEEDASLDEDEIVQDLIQRYQSIFDSYDNLLDYKEQYIVDYLQSIGELDGTETTDEVEEEIAPIVEGIEEELADAVEEDTVTEEEVEELVATNHGDVVSAVAEILPEGPEKGEVMSQVAQGDYELAGEVLGEFGITLVIEEDAVEEDAVEEEAVEEEAVEEDATEEDAIEEEAVEEDATEEDAIEEEAVEEDATEEDVSEENNGVEAAVNADAEADTTIKTNGFNFQPYNQLVQSYEKVKDAYANFMSFLR